MAQTSEDTTGTLKETFQNPSCHPKLKAALMLP
jgi:hypothetical protein